MRAKKAFKNTKIGFIYEIVVILCSFILPRLVLTSFGSMYNGITSAISQFLSVIALFQAGIGGVTMVALYKPLAERDTLQISIIVKTTETYLKKISALFLAFLAVVTVVYSYLLSDEFEWFFTASLMFIMSLSTFAQYFWGQTYQFLLKADQRQSFLLSVNIFKTIANTIIASVLIELGWGIREVKLGSAIVFIIAPLFINIYARRKYEIIKDVKPDNSTIKQRWDNFGQEAANFVCSNTDLVMLSIFSNPFEISVYTVYNMICSGIIGIFNPLINGLGAAFGNMFAKSEYESIQNNLKLLEQVVFAASSFLFGVSVVMIIPFVMLYTKGVTDVDYYRSVFAYIMIAATLFKCYRTPYVNIVNAVGHFKQTRNAAFVEAALNIILSLILVVKLGITGVMIGTLFAFMFRTVYYAIYMSKSVVKRSIWIFFKRIILSLINVMIIAAVSRILPLATINNYFDWIICAVVLSMIALLIVFVTEVVFFRRDLINIFKVIRRSLKRGK